MSETFYVVESQYVSASIVVNNNGMESSIIT